MAPELSVVIPTHDRREPLRACLESLAEQTVPADAFEVVVAVDGSTDGTEEMLAGLSTPYALRWVTQPQSGPSVARNRAAAAAAGTFLLLLDDDMVASQDLVAAHLEVQRASDGIAGVGRIDRRLPAKPDRFARLRAGDFHAHYEALARRPATPRDAYSGNLSVERSSYVAVGGFAADHPMAFDDLDFAVRLRSHGVRFHYVPHAATTELSTERWRDIVGDQVERGRVSIPLASATPEILPWLPLGGRGAPRRKLGALQGLFHAIRVPPGLVARCALLLPGEDRSRVGLSFAFHYAYWSGVRRASDRDTWRRLRRGVPILMYHAVGAPGEPPSRFVVPVKRLERQLRWLARRGYTAISLDEYLRLRSEFALPPAKSVVITFDDGYRDNLELARPIIERLGLRATIFLTSASGGWKRSGDPALDGRPLVTLDEARAALGGVVSYGAHSRTHPRLSELTAEEVEREVAGCKQELEAALGMPMLAFAYPYGKLDTRVRRAVVDAGFLGACSVEPGRNRPATDQFALRRIEIEGTFSLLRFALTVWLGDLRRRQ